MFSKDLEHSIGQYYKRARDARWLVERGFALEDVDELGE